MLLRLFLLFTIVPLVELSILLYLSSLESFGWRATLTLVIVTGLLGATLARIQGANVVRRIRETLEKGQLPTTELIDALFIFVAGALLLTPGILTDLFGFSLLTPFCRKFYRGVLIRKFQARINTTGAPGHAPSSEQPRDTIIDARVISRHDEDEQK